MRSNIFARFRQISLGKCDNGLLDNGVRNGHLRFRFGVVVLEKCFIYG